MKPVSECGRKTALDDKIAKYNLNPTAVGFFGGVFDFNKINFLTCKTFGFIKPQLEKDAFKQTAIDVYELLDWKKSATGPKNSSKKPNNNPFHPPLPLVLAPLLPSIFCNTILRWFLDLRLDLGLSIGEK